MALPLTHALEKGAHALAPSYCLLIHSAWLLALDELTDQSSLFPQSEVARATGSRMALFCTV